MSSVAACLTASAFLVCPAALVAKSHQPARSGARRKRKLRAGMWWGVPPLRIPVVSLRFRRVTGQLAVEPGRPRSCIQSVHSRAWVYVLTPMIRASWHSCYVNMAWLMASLPFLNFPCSAGHRAGLSSLAPGVPLSSVLQPALSPSPSPPAAGGGGAARRPRHAPKTPCQFNPED